MLYALLLRADGSLYQRHQCGGLGCFHGDWKPGDDWVSRQGVALTGVTALDTPADSIVCTLYRTPGRYFEHTAASLVVKTVLAGHEEFAVSGGRHRVTEGEVLILNSGQHYGSLAVAQQPEMLTLCIAFGSLVVADALQGLRGPFLDQPVEPQSLEFLETLYPVVSPLWRRDWLKKIPTALELEEVAFEVLEQVFLRQLGEAVHARQLEIADPVLRRETLQRLLRVRDTMRASLQGTLAEWSAIACMSRFHFLRLFKQRFGLTPRQYLIDLRLERASRQLRDSGLSILDIALECGFASASQFAHAFRRRFGCTPREWRAG